MIVLIIPVLVGSAPATAQIAQGEIPVFFQDFVIAYSSGNLDKMSTYFHPDRGLIQNSYVLTYEEVKEDFHALSVDYGKIESIQVIIEYGAFLSEDYYRSKCQVRFKAAGYTQHIPTVFVFEKIDDTWYLVQSEMIEYVDMYRLRELLTVGYILADVEAVTNTGRLYNSGIAAKKHKATVLYFFSLMDIFGENNTLFFYDILKAYGGRDDVYIFGVNDDDKSKVDVWMEETGIDFVWLNDDKSLMHYDLGILIHPMILVLDKNGRLVMMGSWKYEDRERILDPEYRTESQKFILRRIGEVMDEPVENVTFPG